MGNNDDQQQESSKGETTLAFRSLWAVIPPHPFGVQPLTTFPEHFFFTLGNTIQNGFWIGLTTIIWQRLSFPLGNFVSSKLKRRPATKIARKAAPPGILRTFGAVFLGVEVFNLLLFSTPPGTSVSRLLLSGSLGGGLAGKMLNKPVAGVFAGMFFSLLPEVGLDPEAKEAIADFSPLKYEKKEVVVQFNTSWGRPPLPTWRPAPPPKSSSPQ